MSRPFPGGGGDVESRPRRPRSRVVLGPRRRCGVRVSMVVVVVREPSRRPARRATTTRAQVGTIPQYHRAVPEESAVAARSPRLRADHLLDRVHAHRRLQLSAGGRGTRSPEAPPPVPEEKRRGARSSWRLRREQHRGARVLRGLPRSPRRLQLSATTWASAASRTSSSPYAGGAPRRPPAPPQREERRRAGGDDDGDGFFADPRWRRDPISLEDQTEYLKRDYDQCGKEERWLGVPRFQNRDACCTPDGRPLRMCEAMGGDETRVVLVLPDPVDHALAVFSQKLEPHKDTFHRWIERAEDSSRAVHASATTKKAAAAKAAKEEEEEAGSRSAEEAGSRAAASSAAASAAASSDSKRTSSGESSSSSEGSSSASSPSSTSARVGAGAGIQFRGDDYDFGGDGNASDSDEPSDDSGEASDSDDAVSSLGRLVGRARTGSEATRAGSSASSSGAPAIPFTPAGFEIVARLDLAIATACGSEFLLPAHDAESRRAFLELKTCCAAVAKKHGYARWPGCGECASSLGGDTDEPTGEFKKCERDGELAFSPVRAGVPQPPRALLQTRQARERHGRDRGPGVGERHGDARDGGGGVAAAGPPPGGTR